MTNSSEVSGIQLRQIIEKIEHLTEQKTELTYEIKQVYEEAKANGFESKVIREIIRIRNTDQKKLAEHDELLTIYLNALELANKSKS